MLSCCISYTDVNSAFERLWKDGVDVNLVIAGPQGWKVEALVEKLTNHSELGRRLFWLGHVSDAYLNKLYSVSVALIAASRGEGFGLPIVEAALHGKPVLATDIPVFREVAGAMASVLFFPVDSPEGLAEAVREWFKRNMESQGPAAETGRWITWADSARQLSRVVLGGERRRLSSRADEDLGRSASGEDVVCLEPHGIISSTHGVEEM